MLKFLSANAPALTLLFSFPDNLILLLPLFLGAFAAFHTRTPKTSLIWALVFFIAYIPCEILGVRIRSIGAIIIVWAGGMLLALCLGNLLYPAYCGLKSLFARIKLH